jgi:hypothetical protein
MSSKIFVAHSLVRYQLIFVQGLIFTVILSITVHCTLDVHTVLVT